MLCDVCGMALLSRPLRLGFLAGELRRIDALNIGTPRTFNSQYNWCRRFNWLYRDSGLVQDCFYDTTIFCFVNSLSSAFYCNPPYTKSIPCFERKTCATSLR